MNQRGFTLIELLVAMIIISVLTVLAIPMFSMYLETSREATVRHDLGQSYRFAQMCYLVGVDDIDELSDLEKAGMDVSPGVKINIENGFEETLMITGWHKRTPESVFQVDSSGAITRR